MSFSTRRTPAVLAVVTTLAVVFMLLPILLSVMAGLVNNYSAGLKSGLTLRWLGEVWAQYGGTVGWSLGLGGLCVAGNLAIGVPCAYALARSRSPAARLFEELLTLPVAVPGLATALALILTYGRLQGFRQSFAFILVGHMVFTLPFMVRTVGLGVPAPRTAGAGGGGALAGCQLRPALPGCAGAGRVAVDPGRQPDGVHAVGG